MTDETVAAFWRMRFAADAERPFLHTGGRTWTYGAFGERAFAAAHVLRGHRPDTGPFHVGILGANSTDWLVTMAGAHLAGATIVGLNTTHGAAELARDAGHTRCCVVVTDAEGEARLGEAAGGPPMIRFGDEFDTALAGHIGQGDVDVKVDPGDIAFLIFTSGTTSAPKAVVRTHGQTIRSTHKQLGRTLVGADDVGYACTPLFHAAALMLVVLPSLVSGASVALAPRFTVSGFLDDVRRHGATWFGYTGKPLTYLLAAPERPDDADNPLRVAIGNEGSSTACERFASRFGCRVIDLYGATEGGVGIVRQDGDPPGALGKTPPGVEIHSEDGTPCPRAEISDDGRILNADAAIGEIVNTSGVAVFEGYWDNPEADERRAGGGMYRSGDLGYMDVGGYVYFAGRTDDWLRVDGENFPSRPVELLLERHPDVIVASVFGVPDASAGDALMAVLQVRPGGDVDAGSILEWMRAEPDCGTKWPPRYVRLVDELPLTPSGKVLTRALRAEKFLAPGTLERSRNGTLHPVDVDAVRAAFAEEGRSHLLDL